MIYEFILKAKTHKFDQYERKAYRQIIGKDQYENCLRAFQEYQKRYNDAIILINELDDDGEFIQTIL